MTLKRENQKLKKLLLESLEELGWLAKANSLPAVGGNRWMDIGLKIHNMFPHEPISKNFRELIRQ